MARQEFNPQGLSFGSISRDLQPEYPTGVSALLSGLVERTLAPLVYPDHWRQIARARVVDGYGLRD